MHFDIGRIFMIPIFAGLATLNVASLFASRGNLLARGVTALALAFYAALIVLYLRRGPARRTEERLIVWVAAVMATFSPFAVPLLRERSAEGVWTTIGSALALLGVGLSLWALLSLGRNISVVPQARDLAQSGPYRWFAHPLYVFEFVSAVGLCLLNPGKGWLVLPVLAGLQVFRARSEEALLAASLPGYAAYRTQTPGFGRSTSTLSGPTGADQADEATPRG